MATKKDEQLTYGQMPLPQAQNAYTRLKVDWSGLNRRQTADTGVLSAESNISTAEAPYLTPSQSRYDMTTIGVPQYENPISMFGFDGFMVVVYRDGARLKLDYIELLDNGKQIGHIYTGYITKRDNEGRITYSTVDRSTDSIQRSMVQFNVYENAADVLDGVYVKKLLLFPDKVSMFMKIVTVADSPSQMLAEGEAIDTDVMYCWDKGSHKNYYVYDANENDFVINGGTDYFMTDALDVVVKTFYNDGYEKATGTYNDGYKKVEEKFYNYDGYKPTKYENFYDGFSPADTDYYDPTKDTIYYERVGNYPPYSYISKILEEGDSLKGLYEKNPLSNSLQTNTAFFRYYNDTDTYIKVSGLENGSSVNGLYEKVGDSEYPYTKKKLYEQSVTPETAYILNGEKKDASTLTDEEKSEAQVVKSLKYSYTEVNSLNYGDNISLLYEKISNEETEPTTYYKRIDSQEPYTYEIVEDLKYGDSVKKYYLYTGNYAPNEESSKNCYWKNTYTNVCYCYVETDKGEKGFTEALPPAFPNLKYATVHLSRLFGVDDDRVHVSGFNDYANWNLDTVTEINESNAWSSAAQANTKANGEFTGITVYDNHVVCFKHDYMHEIYNNKNPFRIIDVYAEGTIDNRSVQEVGGKLIFVSEDEVKVYTGSKPRIIGYYLGIDKFTAAVSGTDGRYYYLYCEDEKYNPYLFVYDSFVEQWSEQSIDFEIIQFIHNKNGMYMLTDEGVIYKLDTGKYNVDWWFETDISTALTSSSSSTYPTVSIKHISKLQMLAYIEEGSSMRIYALYDHEEYSAEWADKNKSHLLYDSAGRTGMIPIRLKPRMTANYGFKLHFEGHGYVRLYEMELRTVAGGELFR